ncbi:Double-stranded RNA-binding protein 4 [Cardamine amara subsp. amara]|uniref:Double-stranded RNA-binding protein 4 n=1 Tax=Cardamine amara subsp. amara TaxID=228776 RepID=A0ABD0ZQJ2_CARAN
MSSKLENGSLTPLQSLSPPADASPSIPLAHAPPLATNLQSPSPPTGVVENQSYKNNLSCYCQRLGIPLPLYETKVEEQNAAKFALERLLLEEEAKSTNLRVYLQKLVFQDKARCKMILNEFTDKMKMESCVYKTDRQAGDSPLFVSSMVLNGNCYKGGDGKNKKEAEQLAALGAILSLLTDPTYAAPISQVIKAKFNVAATFYEAKDIPNTHGCSVTGDVSKTITFNSDTMPLNQQASSIEQSSSRVLVDEKMLTSVNLQASNMEEQEGSEILVRKKKQDLINSLHQIEKQDGGHEVLDAKQGGAGLPTEAVTISRLSYMPITAAVLSEPQHEFLDAKQGGTGLPTEAVTISRVSYLNLPLTAPLLSEPQHEIKLPEAAQSASQQISVPVESAPPPALSPGLVVASDWISSKNRRKRIRNKANKRLRAENKQDGLEITPVVVSVQNVTYDDHSCEG